MVWGGVMLRDRCSVKRGWSPQGNRPSRFVSWCGCKSGCVALRCVLRRARGVWLRFAAVVLSFGALGVEGRRAGLLQCRPGEDRQGKGEQQGTAVRRIEGFEKRQRAKPKRSLAHPPAFVRAFQDPPTPLGECRVVLPLPGLRGTHCHAPVSVSVFAGVSLRRPRRSCCVWPVFLAGRLLVWANQPSSRGLCELPGEKMVIEAEADT